MLTELGFTKHMENLFFICFLILLLRTVKSLLPLAWADLRSLHQLRWNSYWQKSTDESYYYSYKESFILCTTGVLVPPLKIVEELRKKAVSPCCSVWVLLIVSYSITLWLIIKQVFYTVFVINIFMKKVLSRLDGCFQQAFYQFGKKLLPSNALR